MTSESPSDPAPKAAVVIGGGIIGLTTAYALCRKGVQVTILDEGSINQRASSATAGIIGGSSVIPWASSKLWPQLPKLLFERYGPMKIAAPLPKGLLGFFKRSIQAGRPDPRATSAAGLANLGLRGWDAWQDLLRDLPEARELFVQNGCLFYYATEADQAADANGNTLRRKFGMDLTALNARDMQAILPPLPGPVAAGVRVNSAGHVVDPIGLQDKLAIAIAAMGGTIISQRVSDFSSHGGKIISVTAGNTRYDADTFVLCAGSASAELAAKLGGIRIPLIPAWGASVTFTKAAVDLKTPFLVLSDGIAVTPSTAGLRVSGLLQVGGAGKTKAMITTLIDQTKRLFGDFEYTDIVTYAGPRPLSPDSLAFLGQDPKHNNLYHNFGHGHWGLTQAAISAQVTVDLIHEQTPKIDISAYKPDRY
ncbi:MAG: FAD-dependent oxidoreductase [Aliishimia sp.]